jgi:hypothetical protein
MENARSGITNSRNGFRADRTPNSSSDLKKAYFYGILPKKNTKKQIKL